MTSLGLLLKIFPNIINGLRSCSTGQFKLESISYEENIIHVSLNGPSGHRINRRP